MKLSPKNKMVNLGFCLFLLVIVSWSFWKEYDRPWKAYQHTFNKMDAELTEGEMRKLVAAPDSEEKQKKLELLQNRQANIKSFRPKIKQLWLTDFGNTDRCMTCHQGMEFERFATAPQPYTTHPGKHIDPNRHPVDKYGCVVCHEGQGVAVEVDPAHGEAENFLHPLLPGHLAESSCSACHPMSTDIPKGATLEDAPEYSRGRSLYLENNCLGCHVLEGFQRPTRIGPILTKVGSKVNGPWLRSWVEKPKVYLPKTAMPNFELPANEIRAISAYLLDLESPLQNNPDLRSKLADAEKVAAGQQAVEDLGCLGCHTIKEKGGDFGPDLSRIAEKATPEWILAWVKDPKKYWPLTGMPQLRVTDEEALLLAIYLSSLQGEEPIGRTSQDETKEQETLGELVNKGRVLIKDKGCTGCHEITQLPIGFNAPKHLAKEVTTLPASSITTIPLGFNAPEHNGIGGKRVDELVFGNTDIPHTLLSYLQTKVKNPRAFSTKEIESLMPKFGFKDDEVQSLVTFLLSERGQVVPASYVEVLHDPQSPMTKGEILVEQFNCRGCHTIGDTGGKIGPDLSFEGKRINPAWLTDFLQAPVKIRPEGILPTRMPTFGLSPEEAESIAAYFSARDGTTYPYYTNIGKDLPPKDRDEAWRLYWQLFSCHTCHSWNNQGGKVGPDQSDLSSRLRKEWIVTWLKNPQKIIPDVRMPNFELYDDETELLTELLMSFKDIPPAVWDQTRRRWLDEQLEKRAAEKGENE